MKALQCAEFLSCTDDRLNPCMKTNTAAHTNKTPTSWMPEESVKGLKSAIAARRNAMPANTIF